MGRQAELSRLADLIEAGQRLITVFGSGGTGKTRAAAALAERLHDEYAGLGGVWWCDLSAVREHEGLCAAVAGALEISPPSGADPDERARGVGAALAARGPTLLVLDNFEHLVALAPSTVAVWLAVAPELRVVVTSREHLRLRGELRFELSPLPLPSAEQPPASCAAVALFVARVQAIDPDFELDDANTPRVVELVTRLEGLPLAIELAACQVELLGVSGLLDRVHQRLDVLVGDLRDTDARHSTLREALRWSWDLLEPSGREALAACSVFRGGFDAEAAVAVLGGPAAMAEIRGLRNKSLLRREEPATADARPRLSLFEVVRQFAAEQLSPPQRADVERRHGAWYLQRAEQRVVALGGSDGPAALRWLVQEQANLEAAHGNALAQVEHDDSALARAAGLAVVLAAMSSIRGASPAALERLDQTHALANDRALEPAMARRLARARIKARLAAGHVSAAQRELRELLASLPPGDDPTLRAELLIDLGVVHHQQRRLDEARSLYAEALAIARDVADRSIEGRVLGNLGALDHDGHRLTEARALYTEALQVLQEVGNLRLEATTVCNRGTLELEDGDLVRARGHFDASQQLLQRLGDRRLLAIVLGNLGTLEQLEGNAAAARRCHERALAVLREVGDRRSEALALSRLARANAALDWIEDAEGCLAAAQRLLGRYDDPLAAATVKLDAGFVELARARAEPSLAAQHHRAALARIAAVRAVRGDTPPWVELSDDIRLAVRLLDGQLAASPESVPTPAGRSDDRASAELRVGPLARWIKLPGKPPLDLRRRKAMRLILDRLVHEHRERPGAGLPLEALLEAGWPGEKVMPSAGANRVYVALTSLRKLGLRTVLLSREDGYLLDPATPMRRVDVPFGEAE